MGRLNSFCEKHRAKNDNIDYKLHVDEVVRSCIRNTITENKHGNLSVDYFIFAIYQRVWPRIKRKQPSI